MLCTTLPVSIVARTSSICANDSTFDKSRSNLLKTASHDRWLGIRVPPEPPPPNAGTADEALAELGEPGDRSASRAREKSSSPSLSLSDSTYEETQSVSSLELRRPEHLHWQRRQ